MKANFASSGLRGFTLLELAMVIVIIGALAAMAVPKFVNLGAQATQAKALALAAALTTGASNNAMAAKAGSPKAILVNGQACSSVILDQLLETPIAPPYLIYAEAPANGDCSGARDFVPCVLYMAPSPGASMVLAPFTIACAR